MQSTETKPRRATLAEIKAEYARRDPGGHFWDDGTVRYFGTGYVSGHWVGDTAYFLTYERKPNAWAARIMDANGRNETLGGLWFGDRAEASERLAYARRHHILGSEYGRGRYAAECAARGDRKNANAWAEPDEHTGPGGPGFSIDWDGDAPTFVRHTGERLTLAEFVAMLNRCGAGVEL